MTCRPAARDRARTARRRLADQSAVVAVDALAPEESLSGRWEVDLVVEPERGGVPPAVLETIADAGLALRPGGARGAFVQVVAVA